MEESTISPQHVSGPAAAAPHQHVSGVAAAAVTVVLLAVAVAAAAATAGFLVHRRRNRRRSCRRSYSHQTAARRHPAGLKASSKSCKDTKTCGLTFCCRPTGEDLHVYWNCGAIGERGSTGCSAANVFADCSIYNHVNIDQEIPKNPRIFTAAGQ